MNNLNVKIDNIPIEETFLTPKVVQRELKVKMNKKRENGGGDF